MSVQRNEYGHGGRNDRGSVLVEFSLIAVALSLLIAFIVDVARMVFVSQLLQETARVAARELALIPLPPALTFEQALRHPLVKRRIYDPAALVIDMDQFQDSHRLEKFLDGLPIVNRMLRPLMIAESITFAGETRTVLRFPGVVVHEHTSDGSLVWSISVPAAGTSREQNAESSRWTSVLEEMKGSPEDAQSGAFSLQPSSHGARGGLVALRVNYPFQPLFMRWQPQAILPDSVSISSIEQLNGASDSSGKSQNPKTSMSSPQSTTNTNSQTIVSGTVKEYPHILSAQAVFRREVFQ
ncbi:MAG: pilus biosynthesis protein TadE [Nitrospirales bacterium]|nr:MAG: pilus biosynthesis protein TadE [Nitrospirales bacterium]